jgi:hypothetical protein
MGFGEEEVQTNIVFGAKYRPLIFKDLKYEK